MRKFVIFLLAIFVIPTGASAWFATDIDTVEIRHPNGQLSQQYQQVRFTGSGDDYVKHGFYRSWYENGRLEWQGQYTNNQKTQTWMHWDTTGSRMEEISYCEGVKNGMEITWNPNSTLRTSLHYRNDKFHGLCTWYKTTNNVNDEYNNFCLVIAAQRFYVDGVMLLPIQDTTYKPCVVLYGGGEPYHNVENDVWIEWDSGNRNFYVGRQVEGKKHGMWILWTTVGDMERVDVYDHGQKITF